MAYVKDKWTRPNPDGTKPKRIRTGRWGKGKRWLAVWEESGREVSRAFSVKDAAEAHLEDVGAGQRAGTHITKQNAQTTFADVWNLWERLKSGRGSSTQAGYLSAWRRIEPEWGSTPCSAATRTAIVEWLGGLRTTKGCPNGRSRPLGGSSRRTTGILMSGLLDLAVEEKAIPANPLRRGDLPQAPQTSRRYLTVAEVDATLAALPDDDARLMVRLLVLTGLRPGEAFGLHVSDLDVQRGRIRVARSVSSTGVVGEVKTHQHREVPVGGELLDDLESAAGGRAGDAALLRRSDGQPWTRNRWRPVWASYGIEGLDTYELRHTAASMAIHAGANVKTVQTMLGHASAKVTLDTYAHLWGDELDAMPARLDAHMAAERERFRARTDQSRTRIA